MHTVEAPVSDPKCQAKVVTYESLDHNLMGQNFSSLNVVAAETLPIRQDRCNVLFKGKPISRKISGSSIEKFPCLVLARNIITYNTFFIILSIVCQVVAYRRLKTKENFKLLALKVVEVAYER